MSYSALIVIVLAVLVVALLIGRRPAASPGPRAPRPRPQEHEARADELGVIEIEEAIDLHGFRPREIPSVVESYLEAAAARGYREVRLIHGRGKGVQRQRVQRLLARHPLVERFRDAPAHRGGWGATIAWLSAGRVARPGTEQERPAPDETDREPR